MSKYMVINDLHLASAPPLGRQESYLDDVLLKLAECWQIAADQQCDFVVQTGDIHHKFRGAAATPFLLVREIEVFSKAPCPVYAIPGNHDLRYSGLDSIWETPFGVLVKSGVIRWLQKAEVVGDILLIPRPWEMYIDTLPHIFKLKKHEVEMRPKGGYTTMVAHASIVPPGEDRIYAHHQADKLPTELLNILHAGHLHEDLGIHQLPSGCWFTNIGALTRVERTKHNLERTPEVLTVTLDHGEIEFERHPLTSARPAEEVFFEQEVATERELTDFMDNLATDLELEDTPIEELVARYTKDDPKEVVAKLRYYLTEAEED